MKKIYIMFLIFSFSFVYAKEERISELCPYLLTPSKFIEYCFNQQSNKNYPMKFSEPNSEMKDKLIDFVMKIKAGDEFSSTDILFIEKAIDDLYINNFYPLITGLIAVIPDFYKNELQYNSKGLYKNLDEIPFLYFYHNYLTNGTNKFNKKLFFKITKSIVPIFFNKKTQINMNCIVTTIIRFYMSIAEENIELRNEINKIQNYALYFYQESLSDNDKLMLIKYINEHNKNKYITVKHLISAFFIRNGYYELFNKIKSNNSDIKKIYNLQMEALNEIITL